MANGALDPGDIVNVVAPRQTMYIASLLTIVSAFLFTSQAALAQRALPSTLGKTVKVEYIGTIDTAPFTVLAFSPTEFPVARHGKRFPLDKVSVTFLAQGPLRRVFADIIHMPAGTGPPTLGGAGDPNSAARFFGDLPLCKPDKQFPVYEVGVHRCTYPLQTMYDWIADPNENYDEPKIGDRIGLILTIDGDPNKTNPVELTTVVITVPVRSIDTAVRRSQ